MPQETHINRRRSLEIEPTSAGTRTCLEWLFAGSITRRRVATTSTAARSATASDAGLASQAPAAVDRASTTTQVSLNSKRYAGTETRKFRRTDALDLTKLFNGAEGSVLCTIFENRSSR